MIADLIPATVRSRRESTLPPGGMMRSLAILLILTGGAGAQSPENRFYPETPSFILDGVGFPFAFDLGDLNGDGKPDLAVASRPLPGQTGQVDKVALYYQKEGGFRQPADREISVPAFPLAIGDFDHDGSNDLAVSGTTLHVYLGRDNFATHYEHHDINSGFGLAVGKIGAPGVRDFLVGPVWHAWSGRELFRNGYFCGLRENDNRNSFLSDLDGDGKTDVVFTDSTNGIRLYYGPFLANLVRPADLSQFVELQAPCALSRVTTGDLNGDGRQDLIASSGGASEPLVLIYFQNQPLDFFTNALPSLVITGVHGIVTAADVNLDGRDDLLAAGNRSRTDRLFLFLQKPDRPFAAGPGQADQVLTTGLNQELRIADLNGDGFPDLATACPSGQGTIKIYLHNGNKRD